MISDADIVFPSQNNSATRFTPRELIKYHIEHPDIPITDNDIENLVLENNWQEKYMALKKGRSTSFLDINSSTVLFF